MTSRPRSEDIAKFATDLLRQLPAVGLADGDREDAETAATEILTEITQPEPKPSLVRRGVNLLRGALAPIANGAITGAAEGAQEFAQALRSTALPASPDSPDQGDHADRGRGVVRRWAVRRCQPSVHVRLNPRPGRRGRPSGR